MAELRTPPALFPPALPRAASRLTGSVLGLMAMHVSINSLGYLVVKLALSEFSPFALAFWRFIFGLVGLAIIALVMRAWPRIERRDFPRFLLLAALAVPANQLLYLNGMKHTVPSHASLIYASTAAVALIISALVGYEKPRLGKIAAIGVAVLGVALVVSTSPTKILGSEGFGGDVLIFISMVVWAAYTTLAKPMVEKYGTVRAAIACLILGSLMGLPFLIGPAIAQDYSVVTWRGWTGALYTGFLISAVSYTLWFALLRRIEPSQVAILTTPQPVVTTTLSVLLLGEALGLSLIAGGILVISGVLLMQMPALLSRRNT